MRSTVKPCSPVEQTMAAQGCVLTTTPATMGRSYWTPMAITSRLCFMIGQPAKSAHDFSLKSGRSAIGCGPPGKRPAFPPIHSAPAAWSGSGVQFDNQPIERGLNFRQPSYCIQQRAMEPGRICTKWRDVGGRRRRDSAFSGDRRPYRSRRGETYLSFSSSEARHSFSGPYTRTSGSLLGHGTDRIYGPRRPPQPFGRRDPVCGQKKIAELNRLLGSLGGGR